MQAGYSTPTRNNKAFASDDILYTQEVNAHSSFQTPTKGHVDYDLGKSHGEHLTSYLTSQIKSLIDHPIKSLADHPPSHQFEHLKSSNILKNPAHEVSVSTDIHSGLTTSHTPAYLASSIPSSHHVHNLSFSHQLSPSQIKVEDYSSNPYTVDHTTTFNDYANKNITESEKAHSTLPHFAHTETSVAATHETKKYDISDIEKLLSRTSLYKTDKAFSPRAEEKHHDTYGLGHSTLAHSIVNHDTNYLYDHTTIKGETSPSLKAHTLYGHENVKSSAPVLYEDPLSLTHTSNAFKNSHIFSSTVPPTYTSYGTHDTHHYPEYSSHTLEHSEKLTESLTHKLSHIDSLIQDIKNRNAKMSNYGYNHQSAAASPKRVHFQDDFTHYESKYHHESPLRQHNQEEGSFSPAFCHTNEITAHSVKENKTHKVQEHHKKEHKHDMRSTHLLTKAVIAALIVLLAGLLAAQLFFDFE